MIFHKQTIECVKLDTNVTTNCFKEKLKHQGERNHELDFFKIAEVIRRSFMSGGKQTN